jgi:Ca2+-binding EF-hand superfamily protein
MRTLAIAAALAAFASPALAQMPSAAEFLKRIDTNADGSISRDEWTAAGRPAERFDLVDREQDGKITIAELEAAIRQRQGG